MALSDLPIASGREHVKVLTGSFGWFERKAKNGHIVLKKDGVLALLSIPDHKVVKLGLLSAELKKAGIEDSAYAEAFKR
jgi:predicted RNA binding protein YcfA (HicA-like mRNA interferase family)